MTKGTTSKGKRHNKSHTICRRCGQSSFHIQHRRCSRCGYPEAKIRHTRFVQRLRALRGGFGAGSGGGAAARRGFLWVGVALGAFRAAASRCAPLAKALGTKPRPHFPAAQDAAAPCGTFWRWGFEGEAMMSDARAHSL